MNILNNPNRKPMTTILITRELASQLIKLKEIGITYSKVIEKLLEFWINYEGKIND